MRLALLEMRRAKLRFGLLAGAVSLLIFLVLFLSTLSGALIESFTGAIKNLDANVLVYSDTARDNIQGSRLNPTVVAQVATVPGVAAAGGIATTTTSAVLPDGKGDLALFGFWSHGRTPAVSCERDRRRCARCHYRINDDPAAVEH